MFSVGFRKNSAPRPLFSWTGRCRSSPGIPLRPLAVPMSLTRPEWTPSAIQFAYFHARHHNALPGSTPVVTSTRDADWQVEPSSPRNKLTLLLQSPPRSNYDANEILHASQSQSSCFSRPFSLSIYLYKSYPDTPCAGASPRKPPGLSSQIWRPA